MDLGGNGCVGGRVEPLRVGWTELIQNLNFIWKAPQGAPQGRSPRERSGKCISTPSSNHPGNLFQNTQLRTQSIGFRSKSKLRLKIMKKPIAETIIPRPYPDQFNSIPFDGSIDPTFIREGWLVRPTSTPSNSNFNFSSIGGKKRKRREEEEGCRSSR